MTTKSAATTASSKRLRSVGLVARAMQDYYESLYIKDKEHHTPIAWCSSVGPVELLYAMGFKVFFPENHAAILAARRQSGRYVGRAHALGFSPDICGYLRADVGAALAGESPLSSIRPGISAPPKPDVIVYSTNQCRDIKEWFTWHANRLEVPCIGIESPTNVDAPTPAIVDAVARQMQALTVPLERAANRRFDIDALRETVRLSKRCSALFGEVLSTGERSLSPLSFDAALLLMGPAVVLRGTEDAVTIFEPVLEELRDRLTAGIGAQKVERHRLYWDGMPVWGRVRDIDRTLKGLGLAVVASTYCSSWVFDALDPAHPFESMARAYTALFVVRSEAAKEAYLKQMARRFDIDGFVFHEAKTCPSNSNTRYGLAGRLRAAVGLPVTAIYGDHVDSNLFDIERFATQMEALAEQLERF